MESVRNGRSSPSEVLLPDDTCTPATAAEPVVAAGEQGAGWASWSRARRGRNSVPPCTPAVSGTVKPPSRSMPASRGAASHGDSHQKATARWRRIPPWLRPEGRESGRIPGPPCAAAASSVSAARPSPLWAKLDAARRGPYQDRACKRRGVRAVHHQRPPHHA